MPKTGSFSYGPRPEENCIYQASNTWRPRVRDTSAAGGCIVEPEEVRPLPTLERGRFTSPLAGSRMPAIGDAFRI